MHIANVRAMHQRHGYNEFKLSYMQTLIHAKHAILLFKIWIVAKFMGVTTLKGHKENFTIILL